MIGLLRGTLEECVEEIALIEVGGVGYEVRLSQRALSELPPLGGAVRLYVHESLREDGRNTLRLSLARGARPFPNAHRGERSRAQKRAEPSFVAKPSRTDHRNSGRKTRHFWPAAPGIGRKTAQRLIVDLQSKLGALQPLAPWSETR
ncbi:MAG: hypothetical protein KatS3mg115_1476 [Candidatus Poribacteria bacterium]|nr:MAG: hypothetical protein KatS3mg115_1476 [Candidatus Poribacteria bacterium]